MSTEAQAMTDEQAEQWIDNRVACIKSQLAAMPNDQCRCMLESVWITLAIECNDADARDWRAELHPTDVLKKHLVCSLKADNEKLKRELAMRTTGMSDMAQGFGNLNVKLPTP